MNTEHVPSGRRWDGPRTVVIDEVEWRFMTPAGVSGEQRFGATGPSGRLALGRADGPTDHRAGHCLTNGLREARSMTWVDREDGSAFVFEMQPGLPPRVSVSRPERGIHVVPLPEGRCLVGLSDDELRELVTLARDRRRKARWADEGGAV